jgi:hypothetical protein
MKWRFSGVRCGPVRATMTVVCAVAACGAMGQDRADLDRTQIIGNRELPKVLYIVPWKKPAPGDLSNRPMASVLDEALAPVDRDVFRRQVRYDGLMQSRTEQPGSATPQPGAAVPDRK